MNGTMGNVTKVTLPLSEETAMRLRAGDCVCLSGYVYGARDAAHIRLGALLKKGETLPMDVAGQTIFYVGPAPAKPGQIIGSAGPTSSYRMDRYTPPLLDAGLRAIIGKGDRGPAVKEAMLRNRAVYFAAVGGAAALLSKHITACEIVAYEDLGTEAIRRIRLEDFPVIVAFDCLGNDLYRECQPEYQKG